jgi:hypothetical protein
MGESIYKQAYDKAREELAELIQQRDSIDRRTVVLRQNIQSLSSLCESEGVEVEASPEAVEIRKSSTMSDDVRAILTKYSPDYIRPNTIKRELIELGRNLDIHKNPLATIYSTLNRMIEAGDVEEDKDSSGNRIFRRMRLIDRILAAGNPSPLRHHYGEDDLERRRKRK